MTKGIHQALTLFVGTVRVPQHPGFGPNFEIQNLCRKCRSKRTTHLYGMLQDSAAVSARILYGVTVYIVQYLQDL